jgi:hypothetical protein
MFSIAIYLTKILWIPLFHLHIYSFKSPLSPSTLPCLLALLSHFASIKNYPCHSIIESFSPSNRKEKSQLAHMNIYIMPNLSPMHLSFPFLSQFKFPFTYITCFHIAIEMIALQACTLALIHGTIFFFIPTKSTQMMQPTKFKKT